MQLENSFEVPASPERAWDLLNDVPLVIPCMPGAELTEVVDENMWKATMHVKLGPISLQFATDIRREQADETERTVVLSAKARELKGRGGAHAKIQSSFSTQNGGTRVLIVTDLTLQGAVAQYGRGIVADVASQLTKRFADCIAAQLADEPAGETAAAAASPQAHGVKPVGGLRLGLTALFRPIARLFRRGR